MSNIFERASRQKLRFNCGVGYISVEDLWDFPLVHDAAVSLNGLAKAVNKILKDSEEESFVEQPTTENATARLQLDILKRVIEVKLDYRDRAEKAAITKAKKQQIMGLIVKAENADLEAKGADELRKMLEEL